MEGRPAAARAGTAGEGLPTPTALRPAAATRSALRPYRGLSVSGPGWARGTGGNCARLGKESQRRSGDSTCKNGLAEEGRARQSQAEQRKRKRASRRVTRLGWARPPAAAALKAERRRRAILGPMGPSPPRDTGHGLLPRDVPCRRARLGSLLAASTSPAAPREAAAGSRTPCHLLSINCSACVTCCSAPPLGSACTVH